LSSIATDVVLTLRPNLAAQRFHGSRSIRGAAPIVMQISESARCRVLPLKSDQMCWQSVVLAVRLSSLNSSL
jgi:hypothetical protein